MPRGAAHESARIVGPDPARDLRLGRAGRPVHRPHQRDEQSRLPRAHQRHQPVRRNPAAALWRLRPRLAQSDALRRGAVHVQGATRRRAIGGNRSRRGAPTRQRHRRLALSVAEPGRESARLAPHRARHHRACRRAGDAGPALRQRGVAEARGRHHEADLPRRLSRFHRARAREGQLSRLRARQVPHRALHQKPAPGHPGRHRAERHPQQSSVGDRADGHHQPARRQRLERARAGVRGVV